MTLKDILIKRKSVRKFKNIKISDTEIQEIIELAKLAPSAGAIRAYKVIITNKKIVPIDAPIYLVICSDPEAYLVRYGERGRDLYAIQDATIFAAYIQLIVVDRGLSSVWIGAFRENKIKEILGIDRKLQPIAIIPIGYEI